MKLWPSDSFDILTTLSPEEALGVIKTRTEPKKMFRFSKDHLLFQGQVTEGEFRVAVIIDYRNSFLPFIVGRVQPEGDRTKIAIRMRLHRWVFVFLCAWLAIITISAITALLGVLSGKTAATAFLIMTTVMLVAVPALASYCFWLEAKRHKAVLLDLFPS